MDKELEMQLKELDVKILTAKSPIEIKILVRKQADLIEKSVSMKYIK